MKKIKSEELKIKEEILPHIDSLRAKARELRKESDNLEVTPRYRILGYIKTAELPEVGLETREPLLDEMPLEMRKKFLRSYRYALTSLATALDGVFMGIERYPSLWNKRKDQIKEMEHSLEEFEKMGLDAFQEKRKIKK